MGGEKRGGSLGDLRRANRQQALASLRLNGALTQAEISRVTGLSHASVSNIVRELTRDGVARSTAVSRNGRRVYEVTLNPSAGLVGGIDFGNRHVRAAVADFTHTVLAEAQHTLRHGHDGRASIAEAATMFRELVTGIGASLDDVQVVAVGLPGPTDPATGRTTSPAILPGWADIDVKPAIEHALGIRTAVDNDANLGALAEGFWGAGRGYSDFAYIKVSTGIGAGLVLNGRLYRGIAGTAGEIGHTTIAEDGPVCRCGNRGCLEMFAAAPALLDLLRRSHGDQLTVEGMLGLCRDGDIGCRRVITDAGRHIGVALANLCNLLSPQLIIVGGELALAGDVLIGSMRESMGRRAVSVEARAAQLTTGAFSERVGVLGALALALQESQDDGSERSDTHLASPIGTSTRQLPLAG